jgi:hypothetical protein
LTAHVFLVEARPEAVREPEKVLELVKVRVRELKQVPVTKMADLKTHDRMPACLIGYTPPLLS